MTAKLSFASGIDQVLVNEITDPVAIRGVIEVMEQEAVKLDSDPFYARRVTVPLAEGMLVHHLSNNRVRAYTSSDEPYATFLVVGPKSRGSFDGLELKSDRLLYVPPGGTGEFVVEAGYRSTALMVSLEFLATHLKIRKQSDLLGDLSRQRIWNTRLEATEAHYRLGESVADTAAREPANFEVESWGRTVAQIDLFDSLLNLFQDMDDEPVDRKGLTAQNYSDIVQRCEAYAVGKGSDRLYVTELCELAHVSERTLQYAFQSVMGMSPISFLARLRLHHARKILLAKSFKETTVSKVALRWGFWHFGDFSRAYLEMFGESPSATLRGQGD